MSDPSTEPPKLAKEEVLKQAKDGLDVLADIHRYAGMPYDQVDPTDFFRFKWYGVYQHRQKDGHYMMRLRIPGGQYTSRQLALIARIAEENGKGFADITTRLGFQFHHITMDKIPAIFRSLAEVGIATVGACGDITRNIVGCPVAGLDAREIFDASADLAAANALFLNNREFSNLPRKYKISISGCSLNCAQAQINCVGLAGVRARIGNREEDGYRLFCGGGLSTRPFFGRDMHVFVRPGEVVACLRAITEVYRDNGFRHDRNKARLKFLVDAWGSDKFRFAVEERLGRRLADLADSQIIRVPDEAHHDHMGVHRQKEAGKAYVGVPVLAGRIRASQLAEVARLAEEFGEGQIRNTHKQNFVISGVPEGKIQRLVDRLRAIDLPVETSWYRRDTVTCTGKEFCALAIAETKNRTIELVQQLEKEFPYDEPIRIHINGCPNACGQHHIADIGLQGGLTKVDGRTVDAFDITLGGGTGSRPTFTRTILRRVPADRLLEHFRRILSVYRAQRQPSESFQDFCRRQSDEQLKGMLTN